MLHLIKYLFSNVRQRLRNSQTFQTVRRQRTTSVIILFAFLEKALIIPANNVEKRMKTNEFPSKSSEEFNFISNSVQFSKEFPNCHQKLGKRCSNGGCCCQCVVDACLESSVDGLQVVSSNLSVVSNNRVEGVNGDVSLGANS
jgi:hypothetical protein